MEGVFDDTISYMFRQINRKKNKERIKNILANITSLIFEDINPYLYTIIALIILIFIMNLLTFYWQFTRLYIK